MRLPGNVRRATLEDELAPAERSRVDALLQRDPQLRRLLDQLVADRRALRSIGLAAPRTDLVDAVMARREGAERTLCLVNDQAFVPVQHALDIDVMIEPRAVTVSTILQHIRRGRITGPQEVTVISGKAEPKPKDPS